MIKTEEMTMQEMKMNLKLLKFILFLMIFSNIALAGKFDILAGAYSFTGSVSGKSSKFSGLGIYEMSFMQSFGSHFEANLGYSFTMTGIIGGDYSYGPKLGINYYPFNFSSNEQIMLMNKTISVQDFFKPYVGIAFNQRQYQSVKTSYAGFGLSIGCEKYINPNYTVKTEIKLNSYTGAGQATAKEMNILGGLVFSF